MQPHLDLGGVEVALEPAATVDEEQGRHRRRQRPRAGRCGRGSCRRRRRSRARRSRRRRRTSDGSAASSCRPGAGSRRSRPAPAGPPADASRIAPNNISRGGSKCIGTPPVIAGGSGVAGRSGVRRWSHRCVRSLERRCRGSWRSRAGRCEPRRARPAAITRPASRQYMWSLIEVMNGMSCSITIIAAPSCSRIVTSSGASASVSRWATPAVGSSRHSTDEPRASRQASSAMRRVPGRQLADLAVGVPAEPEQVDDVVRLGELRPLGTAGVREEQRRAGHAGPAATLERDLHGLAHGQVGEELRGLERPAEAGAGPCRRRASGQVDHRRDAPSRRLSRTRRSR